MMVVNTEYLYSYIEYSNKLFVLVGLNALSSIGSAICEGVSLVVLILLLLKNKPVLLDSGLRRSSWSSSSLDLGGFVLCNGVSVYLVAWNGWLSWQLEGLDGTGISSGDGRLELLDLLNVQLRDQVVASWGGSKQSSG